MQCYWRCADHMCPERAITSENDKLLSIKEHNREGNEVDETRLDETRLDKMGVDEVSIRRNEIRQT